jgi:tRNA(fMet)-specific endonuclease VapC
VEPVLLDTDSLSEVMKARDAEVARHAREYLAAHGQFSFSIITRYEILRGLKAKGATQQELAFEERCLRSAVLPLTDAIVVRAASLYADLHRQGRLISDADILIAATALVFGVTLVTENPDHFERVAGLGIESWRRQQESTNAVGD